MRKKKRRREQSRLIEFFRRHGEIETAERLSLVWSDAGQYLTDIARVGDRAGFVAREIFDIETALQSSGAWEHTWEWRISTEGTERIERSSNGFSARSDHHGIFTAEFENLAEAIEALRVFSELQRDLFWAIGWSSWAGPRQLSEDDPPRRRGEPEARHRYLARLSEEARASDEVPLAEIKASLGREDRWSDEFSQNGHPVERSAWTHEWTDWDGEKKTHFAYAVADRSLRMESESPTLERAAEFMGVYRRLQADLAAVLEWRWL